ncbi:unannotated protein [freshwater metagenome]|uniref:Unannotated protein n=1 Tax=freshwater metagenome TaxID=449393 RepID=A0A6J6VJA4_9ZZZZ
MCPAEFTFNLEEILMITLEISRSQKCGPLCGFHFCGRGIAFERSALNRCLFRVIASEVSGINNYATYDARGTKTNNGKIMTRLATTSRLPTVIDLTFMPKSVSVEVGPSFVEQTLLLGEEFIVGGDHPGSKTAGS